jgi:phage shock protein PspC (stress-responsive transcriptional regulator)
MNKVININFQGRILPIEEQAYEILKEYIESLRTYFANEEGRDEIINDIECRVAELCDDKLKKGEVCINEATIHLIIASIGRPADFEAQDGFEQTTSTNNTSTQNASSSSGHTGWDSTTHKRLYRDEQNKVLGGVCSGIANYFNVDPLVVRILWIFLIGVNVLGYLILWIAVPSSSVKEVGGVRKRLFRDIDNKIIGGVCAGLSKYFGLRVGIIRLLFMIPFIRFIFNFHHLHLFQFWDSLDFPNILDITFSPGAVFVYIILWLVLPEARTSADKLEMVGEKVDLNSIKNTIQNDMEGFSKRAQSWGSDFYRKNKSNNTSANANSNTSKTENSDQQNVVVSTNKGVLYFIGRVITITVKVFVYFILGVVGIGVLAALFGLGVAGTSLLPLKGFLIEDGMQSYAVYGVILFFLWVPVIALVTAFIRRIAGFKKANIWIRTTFISLWVVGWVCLFYLLSSLGNSFSKHNIPAEQSMILGNSKVDFLELTSSPNVKYYEDRLINVSPFDSYNDEDTIYVRNLRVRLVQSKSDSFEIKIVKLSNGKTLQEANQLANNIAFNVDQKDSVLLLDKGIGIHKSNKFRNQHIIMTIAVPVGKRIKISNNNWRQFNLKVNRTSVQTGTFNEVGNGWYDEWNEPWDNESYSFEKGVEYRMTATGLQALKRDKEIEIEKEIGNPDEIQDKLNKLKEERLQLEKQKSDLEKTNNDNSDKPIEKKVTLNMSNKVKPIANLASKFTDMHWVLDRFSY